MVTQFHRLKIPKRDAVVDLYRGTLSATLAYVPCNGQGHSPSLFPADAARPRGSALPPGVSIPNDEFRLPLSHAVVIAECLVSTKVGCRPRNIFATPVTCFCDPVASAGVRASCLGLLRTLARAVCLIAFAGAGTWFPADATLWTCGGWPPSGTQIALPGTVLRIGTAVVGVKRLAARAAQSGFCCLSHEAKRTSLPPVLQETIEIKEEYCKITANRLRQEVLFR